MNPDTPPEVFGPSRPLDQDERVDQKQTDTEFSSDPRFLQLSAIAFDPVSSEDNREAASRDIFNGAPFCNARIDQFRRSIGDTVLEGKEVDLLPSDLINKSGRARLITEEWNGRRHNKIDVYLNPEEDEEDNLPGFPSAKKTSEIPF